MGVAFRELPGGAPGVDYLSRAIVDCRGAPTADTAFMGLTSCRWITIAGTIARRRRGGKAGGEQFGRGRAGDLGRGRRSCRRPNDQIGPGHVHSGVEQAGDDTDQPGVARRSATAEDQRPLTRSVRAPPFGGRRLQKTVYPPSITNTEPVMKDDAGLARNTTAGAISWGSAARCWGASSTQRLLNSGWSSGVISVRT